MTRLERTLAATFQAARWTDGPACPRCFDGADVLRVKRLPNGLWQLHCRCCRYAFSELVGTPLEGSGAALAQWALVVLAGERALGQTAARALGLNRHTLAAMHAKLTDSRLAARWAASLRAAGVTPARLARWLADRATRRRAALPPWRRALRRAPALAPARWESATAPSRTAAEAP